MDTYGQLVTILLILTFAPSAYLTYITKPKRFTAVMRGGEAAVCLALALLTAMQITMIFVTQGEVIVRTSLWLQIVTLSVFTLVSSLVWGRVSQHVRHQLRTRYAREVSLQQLRNMGVDVSQFEKQPKKAGEE